MNKKLYMACGAVALAVTACSDDNGIVGTSTEPNTVAFGSSSSVLENSSSSGAVTSFLSISHVMRPCCLRVRKLMAIGS